MRESGKRRSGKGPKNKPNKQMWKDNCTLLINNTKVGEQNCFQRCWTTCSERSTSCCTWRRKQPNNPNANPQLWGRKPKRSILRKKRLAKWRRSDSTRFSFPLLLPRREGTLQTGRKIPNPNGALPKKHKAHSLNGVLPKKRTSPNPEGGNPNPVTPQETEPNPKSSSTTSVRWWVREWWVPSQSTPWTVSTGWLTQARKRKQPRSSSPKAACRLRVSGKGRVTRVDTCTRSRRKKGSRKGRER